jgi:hypothetical protein
MAIGKDQPLTRVDFTVIEQFYPPFFEPSNLYCFYQYFFGIGPNSQGFNAQNN